MTPIAPSTALPRAKRAPCHYVLLAVLSLAETLEELERWHES